LLSKLQEPEYVKKKASKFDVGKTLNKRKSQKSNLLDNESNLSPEPPDKRKKPKMDPDSSDNSDNNPHRKRYKPYEELSGEFKKIKLPMFNGEVEKGEEAEAWLSEMRKYFHIYNYSNKLKAIMAIYNLTGKVDI